MGAIPPAPRAAAALPTRGHATRSGPTIRSWNSSVSFNLGARVGAGDQDAEPARKPCHASGIGGWAVIHERVFVPQNGEFRDGEQ